MRSKKLFCKRWSDVFSVRGYATFILSNAFDRDVAFHGSVSPVSSFIHLCISFSRFSKASGHFQHLLRPHEHHATAYPKAWGSTLFLNQILDTSSSRTNRCNRSQSRRVTEASCSAYCTNQRVVATCPTWHQRRSQQQQV